MMCSYETIYFSLDSPLPKTLTWEQAQAYTATEQNFPTWTWHVCTQRSFPSLRRTQNFSATVVFLSFTLLDPKLLPCPFYSELQPPKPAKFFWRTVELPLCFTVYFHTMPQGPTLQTKVGLSRRFCQTKDFLVFLRKQKKLHSIVVLNNFFCIVLLSLSSHSFNSYLGLFRKFWFLC